VRALFLDMDGVLNSSEFFDRIRPTRGRAPSPQTNEYWITMVDPLAVMRLNRILEGSGAKVVISSSWRYYRSADDMQRILSAKGFVGDIIGSTPDFQTEVRSDFRRGNEIETWFVKNKHLDVESFVILDDLSEDSFVGLLPNFVKTTWAYGLRDEHVARALKILS
jgi:hypothetical protein